MLKAAKAERCPNKARLQELKNQADSAAQKLADAEKAERAAEEALAKAQAELEKAAKDPNKARLPAKGTAERKAIEAARKKGIEGAMKRELESIRKGGKGSGVWNAKELEQIRKTGKFPDDVRWHHDPTVANRPDLAGDPSSVRPVRGGVAGHLEEHGGDFRKPFPE